MGKRCCAVLRTRVFLSQYWKCCVGFMALTLYHLPAFLADLFYCKAFSLMRLKLARLS